MPFPLSGLLRHKDKLWTFGLALVAIGFVCLTVKLSWPTFIVSDDYTILDFITHGVSEPYNGILFTSLLHLAYQAWPRIPWYALTLYSLHILCIFLWLSLLRRVFKPWWISTLLILVFLGYYLVFLDELDYTSTSVMLCMSSLAYTIVEVVERKAGRWKFAGLGVVFMLGVLVRVEGAPGSLAFMLPIALWAALVCFRGYLLEPADSGFPYSALPMGIWAVLSRLRFPYFKTEALRLILIASVFFAPVIADMVFDSAYRGLTYTPAERRYAEFDRYLGDIQILNGREKAALAGNSELLESVHWNNTDLGHLYNWSFVDERVYTPEALKTIAQDSHLAEEVPHDGITRAALARITMRYPVFLLLISMFPLFLLGLWRKQASSTIGLLLPAYCIGLISFMATMFVFLYRVELPFGTAFGFSGVIMAGLATKNYRWPQDRLYAVMLAITVVAGFAGAIPLYEDSLHYRTYNERRHAVYASRLEMLNKDFADSIILLQASGPSLVMQFADPMDMQWPRFHPIYLFWGTFSQRFYDQIGALGIQHGYQIMDAMIDNPKGYLLGTKGWCESMLYFITDNAQRHIEITPVKIFTDGTGLYRLREKKR